MKGEEEEEEYKLMKDQLGYRTENKKYVLQHLDIMHDISSWPLVIEKQKPLERNLEFFK